MSIWGSKQRDRSEIRKYSIRSVLTKTDRIISGQNLEVRFEDHGPAPAYTDGELIWIDAQVEPLKSAIMNGFDTSTLHVATALNYHELAHCMFMPRLDSSLVKDVKSHSAFFAFNILQDQIDETKFVSLFDPSKDYFIRLVTSYMMDDPNSLASNYPLVSGRLFLPASLREKFKERFNHPDKIDRFDGLSAEYKTLVYPDNQKRMLEVIIEFQTLMDEMSSSPSPTGITSHDKLTKGQPDRERSKEAAQRIAQENEEDSEGESGLSGEDEKADSQTEEEEGENQGTGSEDSEDGSGAGSGDHDERTLEEELADVERESYENVKDELEERIEAIKEEEKGYKLQVEQEAYRLSPPGEALIRTVERCKDEFQAVAERSSPGWHTNQRYGKLNHRQYARALQGNEHVYRRWYEGVHDALDFEVVFLLDQSSSMNMNSEIRHASESLWVLRSVFDELDGVATVIGFSNDATNLSPRGTRVEKHVALYSAGGGTIVEDALVEARRILNVSRKPLRFCVVITDGDFMDSDIAEKMFDDYGETLVVIGIRSNVERYGSCHDVALAMTIKEATELVDVVKSFALHIAHERQLGRTYG